MGGDRDGDGESDNNNSDVNSDNNSDTDVYTMCAKKQPYEKFSRAQLYAKFTANASKRGRILNPNSLSC